MRPHMLLFLSIVEEDPLNLPERFLRGCSRQLSLGDSCWSLSSLSSQLEDTDRCPLALNSQRIFDSCAEIVPFSARNGLYHAVVEVQERCW